MYDTRFKEHNKTAWKTLMVIDKYLSSTGNSINIEECSEYAKQRINLYYSTNKCCHSIRLWTAANLSWLFIIQLYHLSMTDHLINTLR